MSDAGPKPQTAPGSVPRMVSVGRSASPGLGERSAARDLLQAVPPDLRLGGPRSLRLGVGSFWGKTPRFCVSGCGFKRWSHAKKRPTRDEV